MPAIRRIPRAAHVLVALALFASAAVAALYWQISLPRALVLGALVIVGAVVWWWWTTTRSTPATIAMIPVSVAIYLATDVMLGFPILIVAMCVARLQFGRVAMAVLGLLTLGSGIVLLMLSERPLGAWLLDAVAVVVFLGLGMCVAELLASLEESHRSELALARRTRDAALQELDQALAQERLDHARALHDDLGQQLTLLRMQLEIAQRTRGHDDEGAWHEVDAAAGTASDTLTMMRRQVRALASVPEQERPLSEALDNLVESFAGTGLQVDVEQTGALDHLDALAYRIIQEGLTNVVRHSRSRSIAIRIDVGEQIRVSVADTGVGNPDFVEGFGLCQLRQRVEAVGGWLEARGGIRGFVLAAGYPSQEES